jgi:YVTN family beta-propeller protein
LRRRPAAAASVPLLVIAVAMGSAACDVPVASGAPRPAGPATVYVGNCDSDTVTVITGDSPAAKTVKVGRWPCAIAITPNGRTAFVVNYYSDTVTPIRTATNTVERPIKVGHGPTAIAIKP